MRCLYTEDPEFAFDIKTFRFTSLGLLTPQQKCMKENMGRDYCNYIEDFLDRVYCLEPDG